VEDLINWGISAQYKQKRIIKGWLKDLHCVLPLPENLHESPSMQRTVSKLEMGRFVEESFDKISAKALETKNPNPLLSIISGKFEQMI